LRQVINKVLNPFGPRHPGGVEDIANEN
jgi:hypothetical protein